MSKAKVGITVAGLVVVAALIWQQMHIWGLEKERAELAAQAALLAASQEQERASQAQGNSAETARLQAEQAELLRLRNEVSQLRRQLKQASTKATPPAQATSNTTTLSEMSVPPIETFAASNHVTLAWKQTVVTGGWTTEPGKRTLFFTSPEPTSSANGEQTQILIKVKVVEIPEELLPKFGLDALKAENTETRPQAVFSPEQSDALLKTLEKTQGVNFVSSPRIQTSDGVEANLSVGGTMSLPSGENYQLGTSVSILPQLAVDGASVNLAVSAKFTKPKQ